jgi:hypothetical protein
MNMKANESKLPELISQAPIINIPIAQIELDRDNPRIQFTIDSELERGLKLEEVSEASIRLGIKVKTRPAYESLKGSIETKGLLDPIWVVQKGPGKYIVIEGNTRKFVFDELAEEYPNKPEWKKIKARVLDKNTPEDEIAFIRLESHLGGKQRWDPYERARYLYSLDKKGYTVQRMAKEARTRESEIKKDLDAFKIMRDRFMPKYGSTLENPLDKFSYFIELVGKKKVKDLGAAGAFSIDDFCQWVGEDKIPRAIDVRDLPDIFTSEEVVRAFKNRGYKAAMELLTTIKPDATSPLFRDIEKLTDQLNSLSVSDLSEIREEPAKKEMLKKLIEVSNLVVRQK